MLHIVLIGDGMADEKQERLGGRTPMEAAETPTFDKMAKTALIGRAVTVPEGVPAGSDTAILSIFGYDPRKYYTGRSPLEAAGSGVKLETGNISFRCNLVTLTGAPTAKGTRILSHSGGSVEGQEAIGLMEALEQDAAFRERMREMGLTFKINPMFRHVAVLKSGNIEGLVNTPPHQVLGEEIGQYLPVGCALAGELRELMEMAYRVLDGHAINRDRRSRGLLPANCIWLWGEGTAIALPGFTERTGVFGEVVSAVPLVQGIGALGGLPSVIVPGATGDLDTDYAGKVDAALAILKRSQLVFLHLEAPDECTHNGDLEGKVEAIHRLDTRLMGPIAERVGEDFRVLVLSDHYTLTRTRGHDGTPVPFLLYDSRKPLRENGDGERRFAEAEAAQGPFIDDATKLIGMLLSE